MFIQELPGVDTLIINLEGNDTLNNEITEKIKDTHTLVTVAKNAQNSTDIINQDCVIELLKTNTFNGSTGAEFGSVVEWSEIDLDKWLASVNDSLHKLLYSNAMEIVNNDSHRLFTWIKYLVDRKEESLLNVTPMKADLNGAVVVKINDVPTYMRSIGANLGRNDVIYIGNNLALSESNEFIPNIHVEYIKTNFNDMEEFTTQIVKGLNNLRESAKNPDIIMEKYNELLRLHNKDYEAWKVDFERDKQTGILECEVYLKSNSTQDNSQYREQLRYIESYDV